MGRDWEMGVRAVRELLGSWVTVPNLGVDYTSVFIEMYPNNLCLFCMLYVNKNST